jgi:peptidoglycan/LPS O-acetylase OafA/YrhL
VVHRAVAPLVAGGKGSPWPLFASLDLVATFAVALVLHLAVERPFMNLRPRPRPREAAGDGAEPRSAPSR